MPVGQDLKRDIEAAKKLRLPWWAVLCLLVVGMPIPWFFAHFGKLNLFLPTFSSVAVLAIVIVIKFKLRRHAWFWGTMAGLAALHVVLVLLVPWTTKWVPALAIGAIASADVIVMLAIIAVVERFMEGPNAAASNSGH